MHDSKTNETVELYNVPDDRMESHTIAMRFDKPLKIHRQKLEEMMRGMECRENPGGTKHRRSASMIFRIPIIGQIYQLVTNARRRPDVSGSLEDVLELVWECIVADRDDAERSVANWDGRVEILIGFGNGDAGRLTIWTRLHPPESLGGILYSTEINRYENDEFVSWVGHL